jgi:hypothetical protein
VIRHQGLGALIDRTQLALYVCERAADASCLQVWIERIRPERFAVCAALSALCAVHLLIGLLEALPRFAEIGLRRCCGRTGQ